PLSALDAKVRVQLRDEIRRIQQETKVTTIFVTHDQEEALSISDRVVVMHQGVLSQVGTPAAIYGEPDNMFVARFVGAVAELPAEVVDGAAGIIDLFGHRMRAARAQGLATGAPIYFLLRPETVRVGPRGANGGLDGTVAGRTFFGAQTSLRIELAEGRASITAAMPSGAASQLAPGERVSVSWAEDAPRILPRE
ncbi:MAG: ABC transporter ATP-binding protein, partial [Acetobacteraceae bacterium]